MPRLPCPHVATRTRVSVADSRTPGDDIDHCDGLMVLVLDPVTGDADTYGPFEAGRAHVEANVRREELDREELTEVTVTLVRHHAR